MSEQFWHDNLETENPQQIEAIRHPDGKNLIIVAGPGTGKTRVIIKRLAHLIYDRNVNPEDILIVTYTNRSINEVFKRIKEKGLLSYKISYAGTLHSISKKILQKFSKKLELFGKTDINKINVFDDYYARQFLNAWLEATFNEKDKRFLWRDLIEDLIQYIAQIKRYNYIFWNKNDPYKFKHQFFGNERTLSDIDNYCQKWNITVEKLFEDVFNAYNEHLIKEQKFDFTDLLIWCHKLLITEETGAKKWCQSKFKHILVDEFQDMNLLQLRIIQEISGDNNNICCVGDPNQAIYAFQGAHPLIFDDVKKIWPEQFKEVNLIENYRSTKKILNISNNLISFNPQEKEVNIYNKKNEEGENVCILYMENFEQRNQWLMEKIKELKSKEVKLKEIAILYRKRSLSSLIVSCLSKNDIYFINYNQTKLENPSTHILVCCWSLCFECDSFSVKNLLNFFYQEGKINIFTLEHITELSQKYNGSFYEALFNTTNKDEEFIQQLKKLLTTIKEKLFDFKDLEMFDDENTVSILRKQINLLKKYIKEYLEIDISKEYVGCALGFWYEIRGYWFSCSGFKNIILFLKYALFYVKHFVCEQDDSCINLTTIHSSKGCEFDHVIVVGVTQNTLPSHYALNCQQKQKNIIITTVEEERRILYVAITRAKKFLYLIHTQYQRNKASMFIRELTKGKNHLNLITFVNNID